ncbi:NUDIX domain-containing protein [Halorubrum ezzemoulense]|uniref:NUDIX domain-containing protein n=1 Tax=Halorubrum ezzemoulense TaxID=337243 RepID=UPI00232D0D69|nr:NUDIX domain-containing protein [Halorubrum ezzemoulense]MDB9252985.1 NUDIX domain-containing protein [Halorubrum ezzemoulense]MDB9256630.1 NUDIX domain-containing protein [Halorubrum ezzemoulense]MDB9278037.1 NUDIX domain-containing protein [Halorubrum ezzemoulense]
MVSDPRNSTPGERDRWIPDAEWQTIVANVSLVSVDLVIEHNGGVLLGKRENDPAKGEWFVPGGTVHKNESRTEAVHRVASEELGEAVVIDECLGTYEHCYETAAVDGVDSKHYLATGYRCHFERDDPEFVGDDQHSAFRVFRPPFENLHPYVRAYLDDR